MKLKVHAPLIVYKIVMSPKSSLESFVNKIFTSSRLVSAHAACSFLRKFPFLFQSRFPFPGFPVALVSLVPKPFKFGE